MNDCCKASIAIRKFNISQHVLRVVASTTNFGLVGVIFFSPYIQPVLFSV